MSFSRKEKIDISFGRRAQSYGRHAVLQKKSAQKLGLFLPKEKKSNILEIGCGTGFLTEELQKKYPHSKILAIDISKDMIAFSRQKFTGYQNIDFQIADGEHFKTGEKFDLIISNLSVQWFDNPPQGLKNLCNLLHEDGALFFTTIGVESFREWKKILRENYLQSGIIGSPNYEGVFHEDKTTITYKNCLDFLRSFKKIGAHQPRADYKPLTPVQLKQACKGHDKHFNGQITWHILYGALNASGDPFINR